MYNKQQNKRRQDVIIIEAIKKTSNRGNKMYHVMPRDTRTKIYLVKKWKSEQLSRNIYNFFLFLDV